MMESLFRNYRTLLLKLDENLSRVRMKSGDSMLCRKGCDACCRSISIFAVEAFHMRSFLEGLHEKERLSVREHVGGQGDVENCPLLCQGVCLLYEARPVICRTHGFPLLVTEGEESFLDCCPMNFSGKEDLALSRALHLETLNRTLVAIQGVFMQESGLSGKIPERVRIKEVFASAFMDRNFSSL